MAASQTSQRSAERDGFSIDWSARLTKAGFAATDITASGWEVVATGDHPVSLIIDHQAMAGAEHKVWLSGGAPGDSYELVSQITLPPPAPGAPPVIWRDSFLLRINP